MPVIDRQEALVYAHCPDPRCPGSYQQELKGFRVETGYTYFDVSGGETNGPLGAAVETSLVTAAFADDDEGDSPDRPCAHCDKAREVTLQPRPVYQPLSGKDPQGLLGIKPFDPSSAVLQPGNPELEAMKDQIAELKAMLSDQAKGKAA